MNHPESPHQAAIAGAFKAKVRPPLAPDAAKLVATYDGTYGSASPGCCPEGIAAVLDALAEELFVADMRPACRLLLDRAALLRGEQP
jgi:hypothetical protein